MVEEIKVLVTGAAGQIGYSLIYQIANGSVFGPNQPIHLVLLDIPQMESVLKGVLMELQDCALSSLKDITATVNVEEAFTNIDYAILVGAMPRREGMERKDLLKANASIFKQQGAALDKFAKKSVKVLVVGNPANTNCLIALTCAPSIPRENFTCLTRLDSNRATSQIAVKLGVRSDAVKNVIIWGNHSSTQYPDVSHATVKIGDNSDVSVCQAVKDDHWINTEFISTIQQRGAAVMKARKLSSAMSAAKAICDHLRNWHQGTTGDEWVSMGIYTDGSHYNIAKNIIYSMPVRIDEKGSYTIVDNLTISDKSRVLMDETLNELVQERDTALQFIGS